MRKWRAVLSIFTPLGVAAAMVLAIASCKPSPTAEVTTTHVVGKSKEEIGRYIVKMSGCNDCHTPGGMEGRLPQESDWLTGGERVGFGGPWGTSYAPNLRLKMTGYPSEEAFVKAMRQRAKSPMLARPPMPWGSLVSMTDDDLGAIWAYTRSLGERGDPMPEALPPGVEPFGPVIEMVPKMGKGRTTTRIGAM